MKTIYTLYKTAHRLYKTAHRTTVIGAAAIALSTTAIAGCSHHQGYTSNAADATGGAASVATTQDAATRETQNTAAQASNLDNDGHIDDHGGVNTNHDIYHSRAIEVPAGTPVPALSVRVDEDPVRGWNLYVGTANFTFTPADVNGESSATSGHAHLYINEEPIQRIYGTWTHLPELPAGTNEIRVALNANGHETLTTQGQPIEETVTIEVYDPNANSTEADGAEFDSTEVDSTEVEGAEIYDPDAS